MRAVNRNGRGLAARGPLACSLLAIPGLGRAPTLPQEGPKPAERSFVLPEFLAGQKPETRTLARAKGLTVTTGAYLRYLGARFGRSFLEDLVFAHLVAAECRAQGLARSATALAKAQALRQLEKSGRRDRSGDLVARLANEILLRHRVDALVRAGRDPTDADLRRLFDDRYGVDGERVRLRHVLVGFPATKRRLAAAGRRDPAPQEVALAAAERAARLRQKIAAGAAFDSLLGFSDDPTTQSLLQHPNHAVHAGFLEGYNYQRYGVPFATAVRRLGEGEISDPIRTTHGYHLIQLVERRTTRYEDVREELVQRFRARPADAAEERKLRRQLFAKYEVRLGE